MAAANAFSADAFQIVMELEPVLEQACAGMITGPDDHVMNVFTRVLKQAIGDAMVVVINWFQKPLSNEPNDWLKVNDPVARISSVLGAAQHMVCKQRHDYGADSVPKLGPLVRTAAVLAPIFMLCHHLTHDMMQGQSPAALQYWVDDYDSAEWIFGHVKVIPEFQPIIKNVWAKIEAVRADLVSRGVLPKVEAAAGQ